MFSLKDDASTHGHITSHQMSLLVLIKCYADITDGNDEHYPRMEWVNGWTSKRHLDRCLLSWIQQPDGSFKDIVKTVGSCSKVLCNAFTNMIDKICNYQSFAVLEDFIFTLSFSELEEKDSVLQKRGLLGQFCRRMLIFHKRMAFCEIQPFFDNFVKHCTPQGAFRKSLSEKIVDKQKKNQESINADLANNTVTLDDMDLESQSEMDSKSSRESIDPDLKPSDLKSEKCDDFESFEYLTQRQAEYFFTQQAALIEGKEAEALSPTAMQLKIRQLLMNNPELTQAHYLSYLNNLRVKEFAGAMDSLFMFFIRHNTKQSSLKGDSDSLNQTHRFAALNLALLHLKFGHKKAAVAAAKEAIRLAQLSNDIVCLQNAVSLVNHLQPHINHHKFTEQIIIPAKKQSLLDLAFTAVQAYMKKQALNGEQPCGIFRTLAAADALQSTRPLSYLMSMSFAHKASLWRMYGKRHLASLYCQMALSLQTTMNHKSHSFKTAYNSDDVALSLCHLYEVLHEEGFQTASTEILHHVKNRFPLNSSQSHFWRKAEACVQHKSSLKLCRYAEASQAELVIHGFDEHEFLLCKAHNLASQGEKLKAHSTLMKLLRTETSNENLNPEIKCKAYILLGDILASDVGGRSSSFKCYIEALCLAHQNFFNDAVVAIHLKLAQLQLHLKSVDVALSNLRCVHFECLCNSSLQLRNKFVLVAVHAMMQKDKHLSPSKLDVFIKELQKTQAAFDDIQDPLRKRDVVYLLARTFNKKLLMGNEKSSLKLRNEYASEFRRLDHQVGCVNYSHVL